MAQQDPITLLATLHLEGLLSTISQSGCPQCENVIQNTVQIWRRACSSGQFSSLLQLSSFLPHWLETCRRRILKWRGPASNLLLLSKWNYSWQWKSLVRKTELCQDQNDVRNPFQFRRSLIHISRYKCHLSIFHLTRATPWLRPMDCHTWPCLLPRPWFAHNELIGWFIKCFEEKNATLLH